MPVSGFTTANTILAGWLGASRAAGSPDSYRVRLWRDDPRGVAPSEADWGGYTPPVWSSDDWLAPDAGVTYSDGLADFGAPTSAGTGAVRFWSLHDVDTDELCYSAPLANPLTVSGASATPVQVRPVVPILLTA